MLTFAQFLHHAAGKEEAVNLMFEERLFGLVETLHRVADMFAAEHIPYELVGGMAVAAQLEQVDRDAVMLTRGVDVMIHRSDLERVKDRVAKGVHLVFSGESVKAHQAPNPAIDPQRITIYGKEVPVVPVVDLVRMKLNAFRDKDRVHVRAMDEAGLITPEVEGKLSPELRERLGHVRETE